MIPRARLDDIDEEVIRQLIDHGRRESRTLDFKEQLDLSEKGRNGLADDVCSFANTVGGDLVFGVIGASDGDSAVASAIKPVMVNDLDAELLKLTSFLRDALEPRVTTSLLTHAVPLAGGGHVVVLRVSPSPNAPHRVARSRQFYTRHSVGKDPMDIPAIRTSFAFGDSLAERAIAFRDGRLVQLRERRAPVPVAPGALFVCHVVPVLSLTRRDAHPVDQLKLAAARLQPARPVNHDLGSPTANYEGAICFSARDEQGQHFGYAQLFRDGCIELVGTSFTGTGGHPPVPTIQARLYELPLVQSGLTAIAETLSQLEIPAPAYLFVSLLNVQRMLVSVRRKTPLAGVPQLPPHITEIVSAPAYIEDFQLEPLRLIGPALDVLWNAVGVDHSQTDFNAFYQ